MRIQSSFLSKNSNITFFIKIKDDLFTVKWKEKENSPDSYINLSLDQTKESLDFLKLYITEKPWDSIYKYFTKEDMDQFYLIISTMLDKYSERRSSLENNGSE